MVKFLFLTPAINTAVTVAEMLKANGICEIVGTNFPIKAQFSIYKPRISPYFLSNSLFVLTVPFLSLLRPTEVSTALFPGRVPKAKINITLKAGPSFTKAVEAKQKDADEKKRIRAEIESGRERAHAVFKAMTTKA